MKLRTRFFIMLGLIVSGLMIVFLSRLIYAHLYVLLPALDLIQVALIGILIAAVGLAGGHCTIRCPHCGRDVDWR